jgi:large subunit ribosomal protein L25
MSAPRTLKAVARDASGKGVARKLRSAGRVPAVVYGHGDAPLGISVDAHELELLMAASGVNAIVRLELDGQATQDVLLREVQMHPYRPEVLHLDFFHVHAGERVHVRVPVRLSGMATGVRDGGGVMDQVLYDLDVECMPDRIPDGIELDVSALEIGASLRVSDVQSGDFKILQDGELPIVSVIAPRTGDTTPPEGADNPLTQTPA